MKHHYLFFLFLLGIHFILLIKGQKIEIEDEDDDDEEKVFTGTVIKYLNVTDIEEGEEWNGEDVIVSATQKKFNETFYNQLNSNEKALFDFLYEQCSQERPKLQFRATTNTFVDKNKVTMERVMTSLIFDNPQFWWIESYSISLKNAYVPVTEDEYKKVTNVTVNFLTKESVLTNITDDQIYEMNQELQFETDMLLYQIELLNIHSKYSLLRYLHDYIIRNTVYNSTAPGYIHTIYGPLVKHVGVCSGYSEVFKYIASFFGINVVLVRSLSHEWNYVNIKNKWYIVDVTWDDPAIPKQVYDSSENKMKEVIHRPDKGDYTNLSYDYFLVGSDAFENDPGAMKDHELIYSYFTKNDVIVYPIPEKKKYEYDPFNDDYVERIQNEDDEVETETETGGLEIPDINLNSTEIPNNGYGTSRMTFSYYLIILEVP